MPNVGFFLMLDVRDDGINRSGVPPSDGGIARKVILFFF